MTGATINFDAPLVEFAKEIGVKLGTATRLVALDLLSRIMQRTPVDTGRARSGWDLTVGQPSDFLPPETGGKGVAVDPGQKFTSAFTGGAQITNAGQASKITGMEQVFIVNNLPYIEPLEMGHSQQAPAGMVRLSMAEVAAEIELLLEGLKAT